MSILSVHTWENIYPGIYVMNCWNFLIIIGQLMSLCPFPMTQSLSKCTCLWYAHTNMTRDNLLRMHTTKIFKSRLAMTQLDSISTWHFETWLKSHTLDDSTRDLSHDLTQLDLRLDMVKTSTVDPTCLTWVTTKWLEKILWLEKNNFVIQLDFKPKFFSCYDCVFAHFASFTKHVNM